MNLRNTMSTDEIFRRNCRNTLLHNVMYLATPATQKVAVWIRMSIIAYLLLIYCKRQAQSLLGKKFQGIVYRCKRQSWNTSSQVTENLISSRVRIVIAQITQYGCSGTGWRYATLNQCFFYLIHVRHCRIIVFVIITMQK